MNKLIKKIRRQPAKEAPGRITTDTIAEHRERILAGGRRFKYPVQVARHRLVLTAILIAVAAVLLFIGFILWQLYSVQASSAFFYRITSVVPLPVAKVDTQPVLYSDYLMKYRSSMHYLQDKEQVSLKTDDGKRQAEHVRSEAMQDAIADAYAVELAHKNNVTVTNSELQLFLAQQRVTADGTISEATYNAVVLDYYGWSPQEYEHATYNKLLRQKVSYDIDSKARQTADTVSQTISGGQTDFKTIADSLSGVSTATYGTSGSVPKTNQDGGLAAAAAKLQKDGISAVIKPTTGDGYYILKLLDSTDTQVNYEYIHITLSQFDSQLADLKKAGKVHEYINVPMTTTTTTATSTSTTQTTTK